VSDPANGSTAATRSALDAVVERDTIVICCGSGGVGKTTTAAVIAQEAARRGRDAVVVTIDPAKRLANALGLGALSDSPSEVPRALWDPEGIAPAHGRLSALMLDTKTTFDQLITRYAVDAEQSQRILDNGFYRNVSGALSGTQEYMAMEKLYELHEDGGYEIIVVDTPPTRHALDFLDAPDRLLRMLDNRVFRLLMMPTRAYLRVASVAVQTFLRTVSRVIGTEVVDDIVAFFRAFEGMEAGFRERATRVKKLLADSGAAFVLVTSPRRDAIDEAQFFAQRLDDDHRAISALIVNRVHPAFGAELSEGLRLRADELRTGADAAEEPGADGAGGRLAALYDNLADFNEIAARERGHLADLTARIGSGAVAYVPFLAHDVHDLEALSEIGDAIFRG
jgi:anion-transporting  ArsA/GET3 family ATPase